MNDFVKKINEYNLCTWYVLPLLGINRSDFLEGNFLNSFISRDLTTVIVQVIDINLCRSKASSNENYSGMFQGDKCEWIKFSIPPQWMPDTQIFSEGRFSKMSAEAKFQIRKNSGLLYEKKSEDGNTRTDAILLALDKAKPLRLKWEEVLSANSSYQLPPDIELLSKPSTNSFI